MSPINTRTEENDAPSQVELYSIDDYNDLTESHPRTADESYALFNHSTVTITHCCYTRQSSSSTTAKPHAVYRASSTLNGTNLLLLLLLSVVSAESAVQAQPSALVFGASGQVGFEVLRALEADEHWGNISVVGRNNFPPKVEELIKKSKKTITKISIPSLVDADTNPSLQTLQENNFEACFIAIGMAYPHQSSLQYWHSVEVEMVASISRLCSNVGVRTISLLSAIDAEEEPNPLSKQELGESDNSQSNAIGWWKMMSYYSLIKGLEEKAVINASPSSSIRLFQPSSIVTKEHRYGWVDFCIFKFHKLFDPILPTRYHSVDVRLLGMAMAKDAIQILNQKKHGSQTIKRLTYQDYIEIVGEVQIEKLKHADKEL